MKKFLLLAVISLVCMGGCKVNDPICTNCPNVPSNNTPSGDTPIGGSSISGCGNGRTLYKGSQGGCYYINSKGNKEYVDRSCCN